MRCENLLARATLAALLVFPSLGAAQAKSVKLSGLVVDERGTPVPAVDLQLRRGNTTEGATQSNDKGLFDFGMVSPGTMLIVAHRLGFRELSLQVDVDPDLSQQTVQVDLVTVAANLEKVTVEESSGRLQEFMEHRKTNKFGHYFDQAQIQAKSPRYVSELFRNIPGARLFPAASGGSKLTLRGCRPKIWVDGVNAQDAEIDDVIAPSEIAGIEIYPSWAGTPPQYMDRENRACGVVLIWSRQS
jgi:hypothetical protein